MDATRACYSGNSRKLVIAFDIGIAFSGAAYAFLDPGGIPQIRSVTKQVIPSTPYLAAFNGSGADSLTIQILDLQKFPPSCIMIVGGISVALRMGLTSRTAVCMSRWNGGGSRHICL